MLARANDLAQARRRPRTICLGLDSMAQRRELFIAYLAACVVGARAVEDARSFLVDSTPEQWEHAQAELARSAERMRDLSSPRRRLTGTCSCSCADDDATVTAVLGSGCSENTGYCDTHFCPTCAYAGYCDAACGYCTACADDDATVTGVLGVGCSDATSYCDGFFCPTCTYAGYCDVSCDFCIADAAPTSIPTPVPTPAPSISAVPTTAEITTYAQLAATVGRGEAVTLPAGVIEFDSEIAIASGAVASITGVDGTVLSGGGHTRLFAVGAFAQLTLTDLTLVNGTVSTSACAPPYQGCSGPAVWSIGGSASLVRCMIKDMVGWVRTARASRPLCAKSPSPSPGGRAERRCDCGRRIVRALHDQHRGQHVHREFGYIRRRGHCLHVHDADDQRNAHRESGRRERSLLVLLTALN